MQGELQDALRTSPAVSAIRAGLESGVEDGELSALEASATILAAFAASVCAELLAHALGGYSVITATLAGLIVLLPGLTLTTAVSELSQRHLALSLIHI